MNGADNTQHLSKFNSVTSLLDHVREEKFYIVFPELESLQAYE